MLCRAELRFISQAGRCGGLWAGAGLGFPPSTVKPEPEGTTSA